MDSKKIFVPVAWPYINGDLHLGHLAGAFLPADIFARFHRQKGNDVLSVTGSDMHGTPTIVYAEEEGVEPKSIADKFHKRHLQTLKDLSIDLNLYTTTDTDNHKEIVQKLFLDLVKKGYIVKKTVKQYWSEEEKKFLLDRFIEGECPHCHSEGARGDQCEKCGRTLEPTDLINPHSREGDLKLELKENEDFFLNLPKLQGKLEEWIDDHENLENWKHNVVKFTKSWLDEGLKMRPITRDLSYGVPLPDEVEIKNKENKVIYVWFEAVAGYWSAAVEWSKRIEEKKTEDPEIMFSKTKGQETDWKEFWMDDDCKHFYFLGKDNIVFHTIIWPAMLLGWNDGREEKMQMPFDVAANAWLNLEGDKMSKSKNWFVDLKYLIDTYGEDLVRFYFTLRMPENKDSDFRWNDFVGVNNKELVGNIGNFIHRTLTFVESQFDGEVPEGELDNSVRFEIRDAFDEAGEFLERVRFAKALTRIMKFAAFANRYFDSQEVWNVVKEDKEEAGEILYNCVQIISALGNLLRPFTPNASKNILEILGEKMGEYEVEEDQWKYSKIKAGTRLGKVKPLFKKLEEEVAEEEKGKLGGS